ncbi:hypothetical protein [Rhizobium sp.]
MGLLPGLNDHILPLQTVPRNERHRLADASAGVDCRNVPDRSKTPPRVAFGGHDKTSISKGAW